jgi:3-oxoacyl-[acyl-carrier-protein] synthase II
MDRRPSRSGDTNFSPKISDFGIHSKDWNRIDAICREMLGHPSRIINNSGSLLFGDLEQPVICDFIQQTFEGKKRCRACHSFYISEDEKIRQQATVFSCHAGLLQFVIRITEATALLGPGFLFSPADSIPMDDRKKEAASAIEATIAAGLKITREEFGTTVKLIETIVRSSFARILAERNPKKQKTPVISVSEPRNPKRRLPSEKLAGLMTRRVESRKWISHRVVITGIGVISPIGIGQTSFKHGLECGMAGVKPIRLFDAANLPSRIAGEVDNEILDDYIRRKDLTKKHLPKGRSALFAVIAARMAMEDAGLRSYELDSHRIGVSIGSAQSGMDFAQERFEKYVKNGKKGKVSPYVSVAVFAGATSGEVSIHLGAKGPSFTMSTGCAASLDAIGTATQWIKDGKADVMIAGGTEAPILPFTLNSFCSLHAVSRRNDDPAGASRPFDRDRDGMVLAEGSGIVILERMEHALARNAPIYGEILGYAATGDAYHMTRPEVDGSGAIQVMRRALADAELSPADIDCISAHGTSTRINDIVETKAIKTVFGSRADQVPVTATKSMTGHSIGASGGIELIAALLGMNHGFIPPTVNLEQADEHCDLDYVPKRARNTRIKTVMKNSFAFGGKNACLIVVGM